jgi:hypothetical protein
MKTRPVGALALVVVLVLAGCTAGYQPSAAPAAPEPSAPPADEAPLGYYDGYWHNDSFDVDPGNGLTDGELEAIVARAMARVQLIRGLRFQEDVEVDLVTREEFREEYGGITVGNGSDAGRTLDNAQYEALFLVGPDEDVVEVRRNNRGDNVLGFYRPGPGDLVLVSESVPATLGDEFTLAHELDHALQDQRFDLSTLEGGTLDETNARNGLVEGDALVVQQAYERRCESGKWQCVGTEGGGQPGVGEDFHFGVYYVGFLPYAEGPSFVRHHRERGGWERVNGMYDEIPTTSAAIIHPATYDAGAYGNATVEDRNAASWERVTVGGGASHATVGQAGLASMFAYTLNDQYAPNRSVIDRSAFFNLQDGRLDPRRPFTYDVRYAEGWYADRLHAYERGGETAYVWNVTFRDRANAAEFRRGHGRIMEYWGGERRTTDGETVVRTFDGTGPFEGAVWVRLDGSSVTVVKAPTVEALDEVYAPASASARASMSAPARPSGAGLTEA